MKHTINSLQHPMKTQFMNLFEEYILAGEHMDGISFWNNFDNKVEIAEDFSRYALDVYYEENE